VPEMYRLLRAGRKSLNCPYSSRVGAGRRYADDAANEVECGIERVK